MDVLANGAPEGNACANSTRVDHKPAIMVTRAALASVVASASRGKPVNDWADGMIG